MMGYDREKRFSLTYDNNDNDNFKNKISFNNTINHINDIQITIAKLFMHINNNIKIYHISNLIISYYLPNNLYTKHICRLPYAYLTYLARMSK